MNKRINKLSEWLKKESIDYGFVHSVPNVFYLSGFVCNPMERLLGLLVFQNNPPLIVCPQLEVEQVKRSGWKNDIMGISDEDNPWEKIGAYLSSLGLSDVSRFAVEEHETSYHRVNQLKGISPNASVVTMDEKIISMRLIKEEEELDKMREAARLADYAIEVAVSALKTGITELEVATHITSTLRAEGIKGVSTSPIVLFGEKSSLPHGSASDVGLKTGDFVLFDLGVEVEGYFSDITRTFIYGKMSDKQQEVYETVLESNKSAIEACFPGTRIGDIDEASRKVIRDKGYGEYYVHRVGHGLGIQGHEHPSMHGKNNDLLQAGMTFTVEPGIYVPGFGGVRIEDDVLVTDNGPEIFTKFSKMLQVIEEKD